MLYARGTAGNGRVLWPQDKNSRQQWYGCLSSRHNTRVQYVLRQQGLQEGRLLTLAQVGIFMFKGNLRGWEYIVDKTNNISQDHHKNIVETSLQWFSQFYSFLCKLYIAC